MGCQRNENLLLETLPPPSRKSLDLRLEEIVVPAGTVIYEADQAPRFAWFLTAGAASTMVSMADGRSAEIGMWGNEGVIPCFHLLGGVPRAPYRCVMQTESRALRIPFPEMQKGDDAFRASASAGAALRPEAQHDPCRQCGLFPAARCGAAAGAVAAHHP